MGRGDLLLWKGLWKRWKGSIRLRQTVILSMMVFLIMGFGSIIMLHQQEQSIRKAAETRGLAISRTFALMGAAAVLDNLFRIQEAMDRYTGDPDILEIDIIDQDNMIVAAKHLDRIGLTFGEEDWLMTRQSQTEVIRYLQDANGKPILVIVEPLADMSKEKMAAWVRTVFSLAYVQREELDAMKRLLLVTLALMVAGIIGIHFTQRHVSELFRSTLSRLQSAISTIESSRSRSNQADAGLVQIRHKADPNQGELEYLTALVMQTTGWLRTQSEALQKNSALLQSVLDNTMAVIYIKDPAGRYVIINRQFEALFHISRDQVIDKTDYDLFPKNLADAFRANDRRVYETGNPIVFDEVAPHDDGLRTYMSMKFPLRDAHGVLYAICGISTDITERKRAEEALQALTVSLDETVKTRTAELAIARDQALEATRHKSDFMASMSHELRTPLNAVIGFSEVLLEKMFGELNAKQEEYLHDIFSSGQHLLALINDILDLSKVEAGRMELELSTFNLAALLQNCLTLVRERAHRHGIQISLDIDPQLGEFTADERKLKQILLNLLSNAVKFTPDGGSVVLKARLSDASVEISVRDAGIGIASEDQKKIFEEFYQVSGHIQKREGTGLGLALVKRFVELHKGRIDVESQIGQGSTFTFTLPICPPVEQTPVVVTAKPPVQPKRPLVLIVEDDPSAVKLLSVHLTESGFGVEVAPDGEEGFKKAKALQPAAITLDVLMPKVDGWDLLTRLKDDYETAPIPVVIVSIVDERDKGFALGAADYLLKPVNREQLISTVRRHAKVIALERRDLTILVIDDDLLVIELMDAVLKPEGFSVLKARDAIEGMRLVRESGPDLIVLDLMMPDLDGFQVVDKLKSDPLTAGIPIVVLTCKTLTPEEKARLNGRISDLMRKGEFSRADFVAHIRSLLKFGET